MSSRETEEIRECDNLNWLPQDVLIISILRTTVMAQVPRRKSV